MVEKLLHTAAMIVPAVVLSVVVGRAARSWLGWRRGSRREGAVVISLLALRSVPSFFVGIIVLMIFSYHARLVSAGWHGLDRRPRRQLPRDRSSSVDFLHHLVLPCLVLMTREITSPALLLRSTMLEVKGSDFLDILRAKGLPERRIVMHATRNALLPLVTDVAVMMGFLFQGQVLLEIIFAWPGVGRELVTALNDLDYPVAQACFFVMALIILVFNFVADVLYAFIDPRVALS